MRSGNRIHYVHARVGWCVVRLHHIQNQVLTLWLEVSECQFEACHNASIPTCVLTVFRIWSLLLVCSKCNFSLILRGGEWGTRLSCRETYMEVMGFWLGSWMCLADVTFWREKFRRLDLWLDNLIFHALWWCSWAFFFQPIKWPLLSLELELRKRRGWSINVFYTTDWWCLCERQLLALIVRKQFVTRPW